MKFHIDCNISVNLHDCSAKCSKRASIPHLLARSFLHGPNSNEMLPWAYKLAQKIRDINSKEP